MTDKEKTVEIGLKQLAVGDGIFKSQELRQSCLVFIDVLKSVANYTGRSSSSFAAGTTVRVYADDLALVTLDAAAEARCLFEEALCASQCRTHEESKSAAEITRELLITGYATLATALRIATVGHFGLAALVQSDENVITETRAVGTKYYNLLTTLHKGIPNGIA